MWRLSNCAFLSDRGEGDVVFGFLEEGAEELVADFGFLLVVGFEGGCCSSDDSENTGVPCLKGVFSDSVSEEPSDVEEEISSTIASKDFTLGLEEGEKDGLKASLAEVREGLEDLEAGTEDSDLGCGLFLGVLARLTTIFTLFLFSPV